MKIQFENVDFNSRSGPNGFGLKLARNLIQKGHKINQNDFDVNLAFISTSKRYPKTVLRLDGIYFNTRSDWMSENKVIKESYDFSSLIIVQSHFDKTLIERYFGKREGVYIVPNGTDTDLIEKIPPADLGIDREKVWMCASSWRPHKRLKQNIEFFQCHAGKDDIMIVAGKNPDYSANDDRVKYVGDLDWYQLISCMKSSKNFVHLAWLDHCPNVVVDAIACNCFIYCANSGGTPELINNSNGKAVSEMIWDYSPVDLYSPPKIDYTKFEDSIKNFNFLPKIEVASQKYIEILTKASV